LNEAVVLHQEFATQTARIRLSRSRNMAIDWLAIERDYRAGLLSLRALGQKHGCSHSTIANFAGRHGWTRKPPESNSC
jgi:hypothetical protein